MICHTPASGRRGAAALAWAALLLLAVFVFGAHPARAQQTKFIDVNARLQITVADEPDVSGPFTVDANGNIDMLYVNQVHVAGLTTAQAAGLLRKKLSQFYRHPQVVVTILSPGGITVSLSGEVTTPKDVVVRSDAHLNEVISPANPLVDADLTRIQITHGIPGTTDRKTDTVDYLAFRNGNDPAGNPPLRDGDVIYVPSKTPASILTTFSGDFTKLGPQAFPAGTTVYDAIQQNGAVNGQGGGLTSTVNIKSLTVKHADGTTTPFDYDAARQHASDPALNPVLRDGDILQSEALATTTNSYNLTGAVQRPGPFAITTPYISLADAIGRAGGVTQGSRLRETTIIRRTETGVQTIKLNANEAQVQGTTLVYPGDNINIPQGRPGFSPDPFQIIAALGSIAGLYYVFGRR